jgi:hypothetical protein
MSLQLRKLLCLILTISLVACASAPAYQVDKDNPGGAFKALSPRLEAGERIIVVLNNKESLNMRFSKATDEGLVGWLDNDQGYQADHMGRVSIAWEDIDRLELEPGNNRAAIAGKILLVAVILAGVIAIAAAGSGYEFDGFNFTGGGGG